MCVWRRAGEGLTAKPTSALSPVCSDIVANLSALPVFLSGCQRLLVLLGSTYCSRLWCVMEMFVYVQMRGKSGDVRVAALEAEA